MPQVPKPTSFPFALSRGQEPVWRQVLHCSNHLTTREGPGCRFQRWFISLLYKIFCDLILYFAERVVKNTYSRNDTTTFAKSCWWLNSASFPDKSLLFSSGEGNRVQWTKKYNDNLFQAIEFYNGLPSPNEMKISDVFVKKIRFVWKKHSWKCQFCLKKTSMEM